MVNTPNLNLSLLDAAQAQKHITVNEAVSRLDCLVMGAVNTVGATVPPSIIDGEAHLVGPGATGDWAGRDNHIAFAINNGWDFFLPRLGWQVWSLADHMWFFFGGAEWVPQVVACSPGSSVTVNRVFEFDHVLTAGPVSTTTDLIPDKAVVIGITARVVGAISGASSWSMGVPGSPDRYGSGFGTALNTAAEGVTGQPQTYYGGTPVEITASGGDFTGGTLRIAVHALSVTAPAPV